MVGDVKKLNPYSIRTRFYAQQITQKRCTYREFMEMAIQLVICQNQRNKGQYYPYKQAYIEYGVGYPGLIESGAVLRILWQQRWTQIGFEVELPVEIFFIKAFDLPGRHPTASLLLSILVHYKNVYQVDICVAYYYSKERKGLQDDPNFDERN